MQTLTRQHVYPLLREYKSIITCTRFVFGKYKFNWKEVSPFKMLNSTWYKKCFLSTYEKTFTRINLIVHHKIDFNDITTKLWNQYLNVILLLNKGSIESHIMTNDNLFPTFLEMTAMFLWRRLQRNQITKSRISGPAEFILCHCFWTPRVPGISNNFSKIITKKGQWLKCLLKSSLEVDSYQYILWQTSLLGKEQWPL